MKELKRTDFFVLMKNDISVRVRDVRTMEERIIDCERDLWQLTDMSCDEFNDWALKLFNI